MNCPAHIVLALLGIQCIAFVESGVVQANPSVPDEHVPYSSLPRGNCEPRIDIIPRAEKLSVLSTRKQRPYSDSCSRTCLRI
jgi:hypothetical protein